MVMTKNGKPVVPAEGNKNSSDIYAPKPNFNGGKAKGGMEVKRIPIKIDEGFGNQYRTSDSLGKKSNSSKSDEISRNGK